jgi:hypothetical protein
MLAMYVLWTAHREITCTVVQRPLLTLWHSTDINCRRKEVDSKPSRVVYDRVDCAVNCRYYCRPKRIVLTLTVWVDSLICWISLRTRGTSSVKSLFPSLYVPLSTGRHLLVAQFVTNLKPNLCTRLTF